MPIRLSFCIPTYNFGRFLPQTLDTIIAQATDEVEIVIVDGASTDGTDRIVADYQSRFPRLTYLRREKRMGVDIDILKSVELARGEACWLLGADDLIEDGAVDRVLKELDGHWGLMLVDFTACGEDMNPWFRHRSLKGIDEPATFDLSNPADRGRYCEKADSSTAFFSFISSIIVRRQQWQDADPCDRFVGSCWIIAAKVYSMVGQGLVLRYDPRALVRNRRFNDSFLERGLVWRARLSIEGFRAVAEEFFGTDSIETESVRRVLRREYPPAVMANIKRLLAREGDRAGMIELYDLVNQNWPTRRPGHLLIRTAIRWAPLWALSVCHGLVLTVRRLRAWCGVP